MKLDIDTRGERGTMAALSGCAAVALVVTTVWLGLDPHASAWRITSDMFTSALLVSITMFLLLLGALHVLAGSYYTVLSILGMCLPGNSGRRARQIIGDDDKPGSKPEPAPMIAHHASNGTTPEPASRTNGTHHGRGRQAKRRKRRARR